MKPKQWIHFLKKIRQVRPGSRSRAGLTDLLAQSNEKADLHEKMYWFEQLILWLRKGNSETTHVRFRYFFQVLDQNPKWKKQFQTTLNTLIFECRFLKFFSYTGYTTEHGLWADTFERLFERVFPTAGSEDFQQILLNVFKNSHNVEWIVTISDETLLKLESLIVSTKDKKVWDSLEEDIQESLLILSANIAHHGLALDIRNRLEQKHTVSKSSFLTLGAAIQNRFLNPRRTQARRSSDDLKEGEKLLKKELEKCRQDVQLVYQKMNESGVSVQVVHKLEVISALIDQMERLLRLEHPKNELEKVREIRNFIAHAANAGIRGRSIRGHISEHFYLLSKKITERNGLSGEHYVARNSQELRELFFSGMGGGAIVVGMTIFKTFLIRSTPPPMFLALGIWIIYSTGFLLMQFSGFTLATKIPSFTASHLAKILKSASVAGHQPEFENEIRQTIHSQIFGFLGNLAGLIPIVLILGLLSQFFLGGAHLMNERYAHHTLGDLNPVSSPVVFLGALTGVLLWASSICGGWFENWIIFKGVSESITHHPRLKKVFGIEWTKALANSIVVHSSGFATNVSLGFFFGFVPSVGAAFGLNLDAKHVTISTASAIFALSSSHFSLSAREWAYFTLGLILVGIMNFTVSFTLALSVAAKSQKMKLRWVWHSLIHFRNLNPTKQKKARN